MKISILTLFPEIFESVFSKSITKRALDNKILEIKLINIRDFGIGKHRQVDDNPYGGGKGMVLMPQPVLSALNLIKPKPYTILLSASGRKYSHVFAKKFARKKNLAIICGRYEGVDSRVEKYTDEIITVGDYILTGGEIPAMILVDSITRFLPGYLNPKSLVDESFEKGLLEYPQYTRPQDYKGLKVPSILLSGNHKQIRAWRKKQSLKRIKKFRPDLLIESITQNEK